MAQKGSIRFLVLATALVLPAAWFTTALAGEESSDPLAGVKFEMKAYFDYSSGLRGLPDGGQDGFNRFHVTRGYFTVKKQANDWLSARITMDIHQDDSGDYKRRDKYLYAEILPGDFGFLTHQKSEIGIGHMPWLDFEEHINLYRCQGTMAIERAGTFNSADVGVSLRGYLGGKLVDAKAKTGNKKYVGRYGSWHVGVYNGGGYHAEEANENKVVEGRLTVRPLPEILPGLQLSGLILDGKGNGQKTDKDEDGNVLKTYDTPDYRVALGMVSYEHPRVQATAQVFRTRGNAKGKWYGDDGKALKAQGYSGFLNLKVPGTDGRLNLFGRLDHFDADRCGVIADKTAYKMTIGGVAYDLHKGNLVLLVLESTSYEENFVEKGEVPSEEPVRLGDDQKVQLVFQINI